MDLKKILKILGKIMILEGVLMLAPLLVSFLYKESFINILAFIIPIVILILGGFLLQLLKPKRTNLYQKEGFALVALVWIVMTLFGALPFVINGEIPKDGQQQTLCTPRRALYSCQSKHMVRPRRQAWSENKSNIWLELKKERIPQSYKK